MDLFSYNVGFVRNYLSREVRKLKIESTSKIRMISVRLSNRSECVMYPDGDLIVYITVELDEIEQYNNTTSVEERCLFFLQWLERGYNFASRSFDIPLSLLLSLQDKFIQGGCKNENKIKTVIYKPLDLECQFMRVYSMFDYQLQLVISKNSNHKELGKAIIFKTGPDELFYEKEIRNIYINDAHICIDNFLGDRLLSIPLVLLSEGCVQINYCKTETENWLKNNMAKLIDRVTW